MGVRASKLSKLIGAGGVKRLGRNSTPLPPKGYVPVCVGFNNDTRRFIVHTKALGDADFSELLYKSAEEYGFDNEGILRIAYEAKDFEEWMITRAKGEVIRDYLFYFYQLLVRLVKLKNNFEQAARQESVISLA
ncbi:unnamed protein product [Dovyalis caffra]|uniref:Uncharacterized protein n=1 Tax=Dovyalis caffra TaxID=77055 RepID=A0AAV1SSG2_9ROSI|nr:unnamed protein product [Dovyalis caffra]